MNPAGWLGLAMLAAGLLALVVELGLLVPRTLTLGRRLSQLQRTAAAEKALNTAEVMRFRMLSAQMSELLRPYRRLGRWARHPLAVAFLDSYRRRRSRRLAL